MALCSVGVPGGVSIVSFLLFAVGVAGVSACSGFRVRALRCVDGGVGGIVEFPVAFPRTFLRFEGVLGVLGVLGITT